MLSVNQGTASTSFNVQVWPVVYSVNLTRVLLANNPIQKTGKPVVIQVPMLRLAFSLFRREQNVSTQK